MLCPEPGPGKQARSRLTLRTLPCTLSVGHLGKGGAWRERSQQAGLHPRGLRPPARTAESQGGWVGAAARQPASIGHLSGHLRLPRRAAEAEQRFQGAAASPGLGGAGVNARLRGGQETAGWT